MWDVICYTFSGQGEAADHDGGVPVFGPCDEAAAWSEANRRQRENRWPNVAYVAQQRQQSRREMIVDDQPVW